jgi:ketosteroid isomerase-like protein
MSAMALKGRARAAATLAGGLLAGLGLRALLARVMLARLRGSVAALNAGDYAPVLASYAPEAVLRFNDGEHRWAGEHRGRAQIERFLQRFVAAGLRGEIRELAFAGPPWRMTLIVRFDDRAHDADGEQLYANRTVLWARARWGKIVLQEDFYEDTSRIEAFEASLRTRNR